MISQVAYGQAAGHLTGSLEVEVLETYPHPGPAFTQGLIVDDGLLVESSGLYGKSYIQGYKPSAKPNVTGVAVREDLFAEGLTRLGDFYYLLSWKAGEMLVLRRHDMKVQQSLRYAGEGWGLTTDGHNLVMSDGSDTISFRNPTDMSLKWDIKVRENNKPVPRLNELEWVNGFILANVWHSDRLLVIDPTSGQVVGSALLSSLRDYLPKNSNAGVLNGIAWDPTAKQLYVTGKMWPLLFRIQLKPAS